MLGFYYSPQLRYQQVELSIEIELEELVLLHHLSNSIDPIVHHVCILNMNCAFLNKKKEQTFTLNLESPRIIASFAVDTYFKRYKVIE